MAYLSETRTRTAVIVAALLCLLEVASANTIPALNFQCIPCIAYKGYYCQDDPWKVNFNGDLCYEHATDRPACGEGFNFTNKVKDCYGSIINQAKACPTKKELFYLHPQPYSFYVELEPRTSCYISLQAYSSQLRTYHQYPIMVYHNEGEKKPLLYEVEKIVGGGNRESDDGCLIGECESTFDLIGEP